MARAVEQLLADAGLRARMAEAGRDAVRTRFNWAEVARAYERAYRTAMRR
jgi:glycosyltransferase involved in cell wall biosynthesis